ncbi:MAG: cysteine--tRNA ligase [Thermoplasmata archaeon]|nr:cysteine--tRNA ligase [Thermoplasmata archaeon]
MRRIQIYDTLSRESRLFVPITPPKVGLFVCGLTPYDEAHIGHGRTFVTFDVVARALRRWGYRVFYVQNVTNLDDRLIQRGGAEGTDPLLLAERHFAAWTGSMERLGVRSVNYYPFATDYVPEIVAQIQKLVEGSFAYPASGSVYYDVARFPAYGRLSGQKTEAQRPGTRVTPEAGKRAPEDFVLWKAATPGEPWWESPWGPGRPGWHIEDTAITVRLLGARYDLHGGGLDLKFPHHEAEIAQAEAATGESPLVNFWMHAGMLNLRGEKMSKSLGNVVRLAATIDEAGPEVLRFFYLNAHYRSPLDFVEGKSLPEAGEAFERWSAPYRRLTALLTRDGPDREGAELPESTVAEADDLVSRLDEVMANDFNTREAIALLFGWVRTLSVLPQPFETLSGTAMETLLSPYRWSEQVLGLPLIATGAGPSEELAASVRVALEARRRARERNDFAEADRIRDELKAAGIHVEDRGGTTHWELRRASE